MIRCIIIDDEEPARMLIEEYLEAHGDIVIAARCANGFEGLKAIHETKPDLVFLDIQMPKLTGFEMLELLEHQPAIVFTTAYDIYAMKAFDSHAIDYLLKPFTPGRFREALEKARKILSANTAANNNQLFLQSMKESKEMLERIVVKSGKKIKVLPVDSVVAIEAADDYVLIHTRDEQFVKSDTMNYYEQHLPANDFIRVHRSFLVAVSCIESMEAYTKETHVLKMSNGMQIKTSRSGSQKLRQML